MALIDIEDVDLESGGDGCYRGDTIFGILAELRQAGKFCDAVIKVKNQSYPIHRNIMSACSPYFKSLFTSHAFSTEKREVSIPGLPAEAARQIIDFAYTRTAKLSAENIELLTAVSDQFHVHGLLKMCCEYLRRNLTHANCLGILRFAQKINCKGLEKSALRFALKNFGKIYNTSNEFLQLSLDTLCSILSSDQLNVSCEEFVFDAVCRWVDYCPNYRGRPITTLPMALKNDLKILQNRSISLTSHKDLETLRKIAGRRQEWITFTADIKKAAEAARSDDTPSGMP
ncbi:kelch-like protein 10 [Elysia marginata]|uniref:Kelch-like protein 10 n=1 Tax=Elysia marginata TaxID=1093978 RepID=A0AAV4JUA2_9GAST|nr:kelch-like protein 10 [Elysia marginata]